MSSVLRPVRKRKKVRTLGPVDVIDRKEYAELDVDTKVELIRSLVPLGLLHVEELLDAEVTALAGGRYARKDASVGGRRHGSNPGTVGLAGQRVPIRVPRIRHVAGSEMPLRSYEAFAWGARGERPAAEARAVRNLVPQTTKPPRRRFPEPSGCRGRPCPGALFRLAACRTWAWQTRAEATWHLCERRPVSLCQEGRFDRNDGDCILAIGR